MSNRITKLLIVVVAVVLLAAYIVWPDSPGILGKKFVTRFGLDLKGGMQVLMEADLQPGAALEPGAMGAATDVVENRVNGFGLTEAVVQQAGDNRIVVELPDVKDPEAALATIQQQGQLELVDMSNISKEVAASLVDQTVKTDFGLSENTAEPATPVTTTEGVTTTATISPTFHTVITGADLKSVAVQTGQTGGYEVSFVLSNEASQTFAEFTRSHIGQILAIVVDKRVISIPQINSEIPNGQGVISGDFDYERANSLAIQLRYGSLPVPLKVVEVRTVGPTLGQDSLRRSMIAGLIGFVIIILFMTLYYRLPGAMASIAMLVFALVIYAIFRGIPVTLTLPGIAGLMLSIGSALDANILIFERLKEELRNGKTLRQAVDLGFRRAWPSIRDSNFATIITSAILFWFGSTFGATIVKGFSITLFLGVLVSLFSALVVTRLLMEIVVDNFKSRDYAKWLGI